MAAHFICPGSVPVIFHDKQVNCHERFIDSARSLNVGDIAVAKLNLPLPPEIKCYRFLEDPEVFARLFSWVPLEIPEDAIEILDESKLPAGWCADETRISSRSIGDAWLRSLRTVVLAVPSVVISGEWNYLLNPAHPRFPEIQIGGARPFQPDPRFS